MAITREKVFEAADAIAATGKTPTATAVRANMGTGSYSTITPLLREWAEAQAPPTVAANTAEPAPQAVIDCLMAVAPQVWSIAAAMANEHLTTERNLMDIERNELHAAIADSTATGELIAVDLEAAQAQIANLTTMIDSLNADHSVTLAKEVAARIVVEKTVAVLNATNDQMQSRIDELRDQNSEVKAELASQKDNHAAQVTATHSAENRATAAEATSAAQASQIADLKATVEQLRADLATIRTTSAKAKPA